MRILVDIGHPANVHLFKNTIWNLENKGHKVKIVARGKENTLYLLDAYGFEYEVVGKNYPNLIFKMFNLLNVNYKMYKVARKFNPDVLVGESSMHVSQVSKLVRKPSIIFDDTEHAIEHYLLFAPFADVICTPSCYKRKVNPKKHVKYKGYKELAYLHPNQFKPDTAVLDELNLSKDDKFIIVRLASWDSAHDISDWGFKFKNEQEILDFLFKLENYGKVLINSEIKLSSKFKKYMLPHLDDLHSLLYYATLYIGEGATMASEAGVLGTPWIFVSTRSRGYLDDQENNYDLGFVISDSELAMEKAFELLEQTDLKKKWQKKREKLLSEKMDVTKFMTKFIENYPESFFEYKKLKEY